MYDIENDEFFILAKKMFPNKWREHEKQLKLKQIKQVKSTLVYGIPKEAKIETILTKYA